MEMVERTGKRCKHTQADWQVDQHWGDGRRTTAESETGTGQGQIISPLLANIYLHHVLDVWFEEEVKPRLKGKRSRSAMPTMRLLCFQYHEDAEKVLGCCRRGLRSTG